MGSGERGEDQMIKHTPGPWGTNEHEHDAPYQDIKIKAENHSIATLWIDDAPVHDYNREQHANARLIVAAPDLLKACENALILLDPWSFPALYLQIKKAVAKATGEESHD